MVGLTYHSTYIIAVDGQIPDLAAFCSMARYEVVLLVMRKRIQRMMKLYLLVKLHRMQLGDNITF